MKLYSGRIGYKQQLWVLAEIALAVDLASSGMSVGKAMVIAGFILDACIHVYYAVPVPGLHKTLPEIYEFNRHHSLLKPRYVGFIRIISAVLIVVGSVISLIEFFWWR